MKIITGNPKMKSLCEKHKIPLEYHNALESTSIDLDNEEIDKIINFHESTKGKMLLNLLNIKL